MGLQREDTRLQIMLQDRLGSLYDLGGAYEVSLMKYSENYNWMIKSQKGKYALRLCRPGYHSKEELDAELLWIRELEYSTDIHMPRVIPNSAGGLLSELCGYYCTMFSFLEGKTLREIEGENADKYLSEVGKIAAKLHMQVQNWPPSRSLKRFTWDVEDLLGENSRVGNWKKNSFLTEEQIPILEEAVRIICRRLEDYGRGADRYGLIHSDLNINNVIVDGNLVQILDFDDCGFGWFLYDLSTSVLEYDKEIRKKINAWMHGYESIRTLSEEDRKMIPTFIVMRKIVRIGWIASHMENDTVKKVPPDYYEQTVKMAQAYVNSNGNDFGFR